ncbi:MAG: ABC transporter ATP-binding protein [Candidatus Brockarchaeota archaeon]|nr:ABC transporter ATP-binding protein [Candidatus Brockarchaeota archaeon]
MNAIEAYDLTKVYPNGTIGNNKVSVEVKDGEIFVFLGPNGAGKTTFVRMVTTELKPTSGRLFVMGYDVLKNPIKIKEIIGVVPQGAHPFFDLTVEEHVFYLVRLRGFSKEQALKITKKAIQIQELEEYRRKLVHTLSSGLQKRVLIASALAHEPKILILDEPTAGLDPVARKNMLEYLKQLKKKGTTILFTTHYVDEAEKIADRIGIIRNGRLILCKSPKEIITDVGYRHKLIIFKSNVDFSKIENMFVAKREDVKITRDADAVELRFSEISEKSMLELFRFLKQNDLKFIFSHVSLEDIYIETMGGKDEI